MIPFAVGARVIILGIDPGTLFCGYAIFRKESGAIILLDYGCLTMSPHKPLTERVWFVHKKSRELIQKYLVTHVALEMPFLGKSAQNFLKLGYVRGIVYLLVHEHQLTLVEFTPCQIKLALTGSGAASKEQVAHMVRRLLPGLATDLRHDVTDALAISICGLWKINCLQSGRKDINHARLSATF